MNGPRPDIELVLARLSICPCGYSCLDESIKLGTIYSADSRTREHRFDYSCGGCGQTQHYIETIYCSQLLHPDLPMRPLPYGLFEQVAVIKLKIPKAAT